MKLLLLAAALILTLSASAQAPPWPQIQDTSYCEAYGHVETGNYYIVGPGIHDTFIYYGPTSDPDSVKFCREPYDTYFVCCRCGYHIDKHWPLACQLLCTKPDCGPYIIEE